MLRWFGQTSTRIDPNVCPVKQKQALLRSNLPRDNWMRATKRRLQRRGGKKPLRQIGQTMFQSPPHASKNLLTNGWETPLYAKPPSVQTCPNLIPSLTLHGRAMNYHCGAHRIGWL